MRSNNSTSSSNCDNTKAKHSMHVTSMGVSRTRRNLYLVSAAFLLNFSAYRTLEGFQSSLNSDTGMNSLTALYISLLFSSLFLPSMAIKVLGCRKAMGFSTFAYGLYTAANMYPRSYTLIPTAVILGAGAGVLWPSSRVYISTIACEHARINGSDEETVTGHFFGVFHSILSFAYIIAYLLPSITLQIFGNTANYTIDSSNLSYSTFAASKCGLHDCDLIDEKNNSDITETIAPEIDGIFLNLLFLVYLAMNIAAGVILLVAVKDVSLQTSPIKAENIVNQEITFELRPLSSDSTETQTRETKNCDLRNNSLLQEKSEESHIDIVSNTQKTTSKAIAATVTFILVNHTSKLLILLAIHVGQIQAFVLGLFTRHWLKCSLGIGNVGFVLAAFGTCCIIGGTFAGHLLRFLSRSTLAIGASVVVVAISILLLLWEPSEENQLPLYIFVCSCFGLVFVTYNTLMTTTYSILFSDEKATALASYTVWDSLGAGIFYALGSITCNRTFICLLILLSVAGNSLYVIAERLYKRSKLANKR